jgi:hypothetical protein
VSYDEDIAKNSLINDFQAVLNMLSDIIDSLNIGIENANRLLKIGDISLAYSNLLSGVNIAFRTLLNSDKIISRFEDQEEIRLYSIYFSSIKTARKFSSVAYNELNKYVNTLLNYTKAMRYIISIYDQCNITNKNEESPLPLIDIERNVPEYMEIFSIPYVGKCIKITNNEDICKAIDTSPSTIACLLKSLNEEIKKSQKTIMSCINAVEGYDTERLINFCPEANKM